MITFSEQTIKRARTKLGEPVMGVELADEQMSSLFSIAISNWKLNASLSKLSDNKLEEISSDWVENYFQALCKESLGRIRSKYLGELPIPGQSVTLEYESLLRESTQEKEDLVSLLIPPINKVLLAAYINIGSMDSADSQKYLSKVSKIIGSDKNYKVFVMAVRDQESKIECVYPNFVYDEEMKNKLNGFLDNLIDKANKDEQ